MHVSYCLITKNDECFIGLFVILLFFLIILELFLKSQMSPTPIIIISTIKPETRLAINFTELLIRH